MRRGGNLGTAVAAGQTAIDAVRVKGRKTIDDDDKLEVIK